MNQNLIIVRMSIAIVSLFTNLTVSAETEKDPCDLPEITMDYDQVSDKSHKANEEKSILFAATYKVKSPSQPTGHLAFFLKSKLTQIPDETFECKKSTEQKDKNGKYDYTCSSTLKLAGQSYDQFMQLDKANQVASFEVCDGNRNCSHVKCSANKDKSIRSTYCKANSKKGDDVDELFKKNFDRVCITEACSADLDQNTSCIYYAKDLEAKNRCATIRDVLHEKEITLFTEKQATDAISRMKQEHAKKFGGDGSACDKDLTTAAVQPIVKDALAAPIDGSKNLSDIPPATNQVRDDRIPPNSGHRSIAVEPAK